MLAWKPAIQRTRKSVLHGAAFSCSIFLCLRAAADAILPLPAEVTMNKDATRGGRLIVQLKLESGNELPFVVDTGTAITMFDKSWEPKLGKRLGSIRLENSDGRAEKSETYTAPKLFLGETRLTTGNRVGVCDIGGPGILGMDCLRHYCIQLDFAAAKVRFLDSEHADIGGWGKAIPLKLHDPGVPVIAGGGFIPARNLDVVVDTGCILLDGTVRPEILRRQLRQKQAEAVPVLVVDGSTNRWMDSGRCGRISELIWNGQNYTNVLIGRGVNLLGMRFLARHLVTLDFPNRTLYLKQTSVGPLKNENIKQL